MNDSLCINYRTFRQGLQLGDYPCSLDYSDQVRIQQLRADVLVLSML